jgi:hypothetical protein
MASDVLVLRTGMQRKQIVAGFTAASLLLLLFLIGLRGLVVAPLVFLCISTVNVLAAGEVMQRSEVLVGQAAASCAALLAGAFDSPLSTGGAILVWLLVAIVAKLRGRRLGAQHWLFSAAVLTSALAGVIFFWAFREVFFALSEPPRLPSGAIARMAPIPYLTTQPLELAAHASYHALAGAGFGLMSSVLLFFVAWIPIRAGERWGWVTLLVAGAQAAGLPILAQARYGHAHDIWTPAILWMLSLSAVGIGLTLQRGNR